MSLWASANGSVVLSSLNIESIENVSPFVNRVTFSGSPTLTSIVKGFQLVVSGCTNSIHDGTFEIAQNPDNTNKTIDIYNFLVEDSSQDEASSPGTAIAKQNAALKQEPSAAAVAAGMLNGQRPAAGVLNWIFSQYARVKMSVVNVGYSTIASSTYVPIGGEGITVCPIQSASAWGSTIGVNGTPTDVTSSTISPKTTAGSIVIVGSSFAADYAGTDNNGRTMLNINGSALTGANLLWLPAEKSAQSHFHLITSATGGIENFKQQAYSNGVITDIVTSSGRTWAAEFASTAAAGTASKTSNQNSSLTDTYETITSLSVTISPTNNPVLLLYTGNFGLGAAGYTTGFRFTDGSTNWGEWLYRNDPGAGTAYGAAMAWLTESLNGSKTFYGQFKSVTGDVLNVQNQVLHAIEITGDVQQAKPAGTCAVTSTEATITDGTTPLSLTFTPASSGKYLAILTFYGERTAGSNFLSAIKIKQGSTVLCNVPHERETASGYKSPVTLVAPTGRLTAGTSYIFTATAQAGAGTTYDLKNCALFLIECQEVTASFSGEGATASLSNVAEGRTEVTLDSQFVCSTDDAFSLALIENVNGAGEVTVKEWILTAPGTADQLLPLRWVRPTNLTAGDNVTYRVDAKKATGEVIMADGGQFSVKEVPSLV